MEQKSPDTGIRNAEVRYKERVNSLTTSGTIYARGQRQSRARDVEEDMYAHAEYRGREEELTRTRIQEDAYRLAEEQGLEFSGEEIEKILQDEKPEAPDFPYLILFLALLKDILDTLDLTGIGAVVTTLLSALVGVILFAWLYRGFSGPAWKKKHAEKMAKRLLLVLGLEFIPILKIIPTNTIWVLMSHFEEKHLAEKIGSILGSLEQLRRFKRVQ
jgi:hypothetical protein